MTTMIKPDKLSNVINEKPSTKYLYGADEIARSLLGKIVVIYEKDGSQSYHKVFEKNGTMHMICFGIIAKNGKIVDIYG